MWILLLPLFLFGCSAGFHREELRSALGTSPPQVTANIQAELKKRPQLPKPFSLAVHFRPVANSDHSRWRAEDKAPLLKMTLPRAEVKAIAPLIQTPRSENLSDLRLAAAQQGADALLVVKGAEERVVSTNTAALSYLLLLPLFLVHGNDYESLFLAQASLFDVKNEYLYLGAEAEAEKKVSRPFAFPDSKGTMLELRKEAMRSLAEETQAQFAALQLPLP